MRPFREPNKHLNRNSIQQNRAEFRARSRHVPTVCFSPSPGLIIVNLSPALDQRNIRVCRMVQVANQTIPSPWLFRLRIARSVLRSTPGPPLGAFGRDTRVRRDGQTYHKPRGVGGNPQVKIDKAMEEQSHCPHCRAHLNPAPPVPQAFLDAAERNTKKKHDCHQNQCRPRQPGFSHSLQNVIMGVGPMQFGGKRHVFWKSLLEASHAYSHPKMASSNMKRVNPHPKPVSDCYFQGSIGFKNRPRTATHVPSADHPGKSADGNQHNSQ